MSLIRKQRSVLRHEGSFSHPVALLEHAAQTVLYSPLAVLHDDDAGCWPRAPNFACHALLAVSTRQLVLTVACGPWRNQTPLWG